MNQIEIVIKGIPQPKQSARFRIISPKEKKSFISSYQSKDVKDMEQSIKVLAKRQLPEGFKILDCPIHVEVDYIFPLPTSASKKLKENVENGAIEWKYTKPDLTDNLNKGLFDALSEVVYTNDSRIVSLIARKLYGKEPKTVVKFSIDV